MSINYAERSVVAPTVLADSPHSPAPRKRKQRDLEFRFFIDQRGRQHFNFRQKIWLDASVPMAFTRVYSVALKTLAANLLTLAIDRPGRNAILLAPAFSRECLMGAPDRAWALPKATIQAWLESKRRRLHRARRARAKTGIGRQPRAALKR
jgi:hypothetical protein